jgi:4-amino-4-deoxy-L-arabinose transferase-like glycosyltransferase
MGQQLNFAPVSGGPSTRRRLVVGWLRINGWFGLGALAVGVILAVAGNAALRSLFLGHVLTAPLTAVGCAGLLLAARDLAAGKRRGAYAAGTIFALALLTPFEGFLVGFLGLGAVISVWGELE